MKISELQEVANFYGFDVNDISDRIGYQNRKGKTYGIFDRRDGRLVASYAAANPKLKEFFDRFNLS
ncbi:MAG: hypothetical protein HC874_23590 [Richelia sp. SL_2_1]|nr:hypothetical protein [Richelia sp. SL_2_1]